MASYQQKIRPLRTYTETIPKVCPVTNEELTWRFVYREVWAHPDDIMPTAVLVERTCPKYRQFPVCSSCSIDSRISKYH